MKHLLLLRHAKSDWDDTGLADHDRPLAPRGVRDAPRIGKALSQRQPQPDHILSSTALRTRQTIEAVLQASALPLEPQFVSALYAATPNTILEVLRSLPVACHCVLCVGHNPGMEGTLTGLTGQREPMPTAALACIALDITTWEEIADGTGRLLWVVTPKHLDDEERRK